MSVTFTCPGCHAVGHRAAPFPGPNSETLTAPQGHEIEQVNGERWIVCYASGGADRWPVALPREDGAPDEDPDRG